MKKGPRPGVRFPERARASHNYAERDYFEGLLAFCEAHAEPGYHTWLALVRQRFEKYRPVMTAGSRYVRMATETMALRVLQERIKQGQQGGTAA